MAHIKKQLIFLVSLFFSIFVLSSFSSVSAAYASQPPATIQRSFNTITFLGDSLTAGLYASIQSNDFKDQFINILHTNDPLSGQNAQAIGIRGFMVHDMLLTLQDMYQNPQNYQQTAPQNNDLLVVELGTNDDTGATNFTQFQNDYTSIIALLQQHSPKALIMCLSVWQIGKLEFHKQ